MGFVSGESLRTCVRKVGTHVRSKTVKFSYIWVTVCAETETYAAKALAIDEEGRLVIQRENGRQEALRCGEVTTRPARTE